MPTLTVDAHQEDLDDVNYISWPSYNITTTAGDKVLAYRGTVGLDAGQQYITITGSDGSTILRFGAYWNGLLNASSGFIAGSPSSGSFTCGGRTCYYNGPYCTVPANAAIDLNDAAWTDIEELTQLDYFTDPYTGEIPHNPRSSPQSIHGGHLRGGAVGLAHLSKANVITGGIVGGSLRIDGGNLVLNAIVNNSATSDALYWRTVDGSGETGNPGYYKLLGSMFTPSRTTHFIGSNSSTVNSQIFPSAGPAGCVVTFCNLFPGQSSQPTDGGAGTGSLPAATGYYLRYCLVKPSVTMFRGGGLGNYSQDCESALSTIALATTTSDGLNTHSLVFTLPDLSTYINAGWQLRIYASPQAGLGGADGDMGRLVLNTNYTLSGSSAGYTVTFTAMPSPTVSSTNPRPGRGFAAWPGSSKIGIQWDDSGLIPYFTAVANISQQADTTNGNYMVLSGMDGMGQNQGAQHSPQSIHGGETTAVQDMIAPKAIYPAGHIHSYTTQSGATPYDTTKVLNADGSGGSQWASISSLLPNPLSLSGSSAGLAIISGTNSSNAVLSYGVHGTASGTAPNSVGVLGEATGGGSGIYGLSRSTGAALLAEATSTGPIALLYSGGGEVGRISNVGALLLNSTSSAPVKGDLMVARGNSTYGGVIYFYDGTHYLYYNPTTNHLIWNDGADHILV